ncbi:MAG: serine/threonine protein kinase bacterial [bacterium]|nr:MAG: serine/threonine protein kinase bacterial [bacterium]
MTEASEQLANGSVLANRYKIVKQLGGGGMGNVYLATDNHLADAQRAVKEMIGKFPDEASRKKAIEDFQREASVLSKLEHPSIPTVFDYFASNEGRYYLVMKYIQGRDLEQELKVSETGWLPEAVVVDWSIQLCDVFDYVHNLDPPIIYRDMKPANVMLDNKLKRAMLVDFGIARFVSPTQKNVTAIGTMGYAPPELFAGKVEARSDLYSLGATMFHLLTGEDPQSNPLLLFDFTRFPRPMQINPKLTKGIDEIIGKCVAHKPVDRFKSAADMKKALEKHRFALESAASEPTIEGMLTIIHCSAGITAAFLINKETNLIGRNDPARGIIPEIDLSSYDSSGKVSRRHAILHFDGKQFFIEDLGSANGSMLDGAMLPPQQRKLLNTGAQIYIGDTAFEFSIRS